MTEEFGPWVPLAIDEVAQLLDPLGLLSWVAGGHAGTFTSVARGVTAMSDIIERFRALPVIDDRTPEEMLGDDDRGLPA